ncbi:BMP family lipoprotein [Youngiibacter fragilis]|uniref:ABC transporter substrate-binding protein PnrA-like domain-containing protein n=1 Tax=Youngiibacter fragilis 232.1 TaxID=994573 RepID=V7I592_9CLOT|nr:BMP family ABC transporter substrate-binding protein [Youngiibacter fragilis]ETA81415.1 hypothetical protein T472_0206320 [Youngiibacter fragilis 232.1]
MKKVSRLVVACLLLVMMVVTGCSSKDPAPTTTPSGTTAQTESKGKVAVILGVGGLGDQGYNDLIYAGAQRAKDELGVDFDYAEPKQISEYELIFRDMSSSGEYEVIVGVGFDQVDPLVKVCAEYPDQKYAIIDGVIDAPNVASYVNKEEEGSFLVGVLAGLMAKNAEAYKLTGSEKIGFIGAMEIPFLVKFYAGYMAGAKYVNPAAETMAGYVAGNNPFADTSTAKEIALSQNSKGAGIIYHAAGGSGLGLFQAAAEADFVAIGCNSNQNGLEPDHIVASMLKRVDTASFEIIKAAVIDKNLSVGKQVVLGVKEEGIGYTLENSKIVVSPDDVKIIEKIAEKIKSGEIVVPTTLDDAAKFLEANKYE